MADKKYMDFSDVKLQQPLSSVKRTEKTNDTLIIPANFLTTMERFFDAEELNHYRLKPVGSGVLLKQPKAVSP